MTYTRWLVLFLTGAAFLDGSACRAQGRGRERPTKREYVQFPYDGDLTQLLIDKLQAERGRLLGKQLLDKYGDQFKQFKLSDRALDGLNLNDPRLRQTLKDLVRDKQAEFQWKPEDVKAIERFLQKEPPKPPESVKPPQGEQPSPLPPLGGTPPLQDGPAQWPQGSAPAQAEPGLEEKLSHWAEKWLHRLEHSQLGRKLQETSAWQRGLEELQGFVSDRVGGKMSLPLEGLDKLTQRLNLAGGWDFSLPEMNWVKLPNVSISDLPRPNLHLSLPDFHFGGPGSGGGLPGLGGASGTALGTAALWLALAVLAALVLWRLGSRSTWAVRRAGAVGWVLGPWPVNPALVTTRAELVQAFEHLALLRLGLAARTRNHRDIAERLEPAAADDARRRAAVELAALYEQARYAPDDEPLTTPDLDAARRDLCLLAGVVLA